MKRAIAVGYLGLIVYFSMTLLVAMLSPQPAPMMSAVIIVVLGLSLSVVAYLLVRKNPRVTIERRAALLAAILVILFFVAATGEVAIGERVLAALIWASAMAFVVFSLAVTIHVAAHLVAWIVRRSVAA